MGLVQLLEEVRLSALKMGVSLKVKVWGKPQDLCRLQGAGLTSRLGSGSWSGSSSSLVSLMVKVVVSLRVKVSHKVKVGVSLKDWGHSQD